MIDELSWQSKICRRIKERGGFARKIEFKMQGGCPDLYVAYPYKKPTFVEVKMGHMQLDELQKRTVREMIKYGQRVIGLCIFMDGNKIEYIQFEPLKGTELHRSYEIIHAIFHEIS